MMIGIGIYLHTSGESVGIIPVLTVLGLIIGLVFGFLLSVLTEIPTKYETRYEVQISDGVSMREFTEKYEIIDQRGQIFVIKEK
jgi:hypothetical protein